MALVAKVSKVAHGPLIVHSYNMAPVFLHMKSLFCCPYEDCAQHGQSKAKDLLRGRGSAIKLDFAPPLRFLEIYLE